MAQNVWFYPLGVGDAFTAKHFFVNGLFHVDGREFLVDAPAYMGKMWAENNAVGEEQVDITRYKELFITHMHADHVGGLEELGYFQMYKTDNPIKLYAPGWLLQDIWTHLRPALEPSVREEGGLANFDWFFEPIPLDRPEVSGLQGGSHVDFGTFSVDFTFTKHLPKTLMYKFDFGNFRFGYSPDAAFDRDCLDWLSDCDLVMHDCWFGEVKVLGGDIRNLHSPIEDLLTMPVDFQRKTLLCHYADGAYDDDPAAPNENIGDYHLMRQNRKYHLVVDGRPLSRAEWLDPPKG
ncbi:MAG: MBL fold metallo-hydrolase [Pseudonocardia sp.]